MIFVLVRIFEKDHMISIYVTIIRTYVNNNKESKTLFVFELWQTLRDSI